MHKFIGMFALVIFDEEKQEIFIARDRAGIKPFFYYWKDGLFLFASELKAIMQHPHFVKQININAVAAFMQFGYVPTPHCIFENTYKLKPGHFLYLNLSKKEFITLQYWSVYEAYNKPILKISLPDAIIETEKLLLSACQYRMISDVPVGVFLSGGYDSSCVTALLQFNNKEKIKTFTIGVPDAGLNEAPYAKKISTYLGTDHTEYYCSEKEALEIIPQLPYFYDEPFADRSAIPTTLVCKIAKQNVTVALSADAGDEIFAGYNRYDYVTNFGKKIKKLPATLRNLTAASMAIIPPNLIPYFNKKQYFQNRYNKLQNLLKNASDKNILMSVTSLNDELEIKNLFINKIHKIDTAFDSIALKKDNYSTLSYMMAIDYETYLPDDILQKVDRASMSVSLEGREPFLDHRIIEWAAQIPMEFKYSNGNKKFILKEILHKYIPKEMLDRPKMGFGIPLDKWLKGALKPFVEHYFEEPFIKNQNIFNFKEILKIKTAFYYDNTVRAEKIWYILMFQMWYDKWINNK